MTLHGASWTVTTADPLDCTPTNRAAWGRPAGLLDRIRRLIWDKA